VPKADSKDIEYTCPMHPQVRLMGPGNCPICGMALEPVMATAQTGAREKTSGAIRALLDLAPKEAVRVNADGTDERVSLEAVQVGELLRVRPGDKVPVDGELTDGKGTVDESMVTGEPMPVAKSPGSKLTAGTLNQTGGFVMRAEKVGADTLLSQIVHMVAASQRSRAPIQRMADQVAGWFVPVVIAVAVLAFVAWLVWGPSPAFSYALIAAVAVLIIACPCALGLATPMSIMVEGFDAGNVLQKLASVERASEHPLAAAIVADALERKLALSPVTDFDSPVGKGVVGLVDGARIVCGSAKFLAENGIVVITLVAAAETVSAKAATVIFVGKRPRWCSG
jgi:Cu+-exporting ATPase